MENVMHCTMRSNISHCFIDKIQEGVVVCMRSFTVQKRDEYRIIKDNDHFIELNGSTLVRKAGKQVGGFVRHPFQLMEFEKIQPTKKKYLIDVIGFIVTVGKYAHPRTGSKTLDFHLINERSKPRNGTLQELLNATTFQCEDDIMHIRTKNNWYYPACGSGKCKKGVTHKDGQLWCDACDKPVSYPKIRFRLEVYVRDETAETVVVMWDETATELTKTSAKVLLDGLDEFESSTCTKVFASNNSTVIELPDMTEVSDDDAPDSSSNTHKSPLKRLVRPPQVCTPSKASEQQKKGGYVEEDSGAEDETVEANPVDKHAKEHEE
ncbi:hypothetical protein OROMI_011725 [Orobanche minor]